MKKVTTFDVPLTQEEINAAFDGMMFDRDYEGIKKIVIRQGRDTEELLYSGQVSTYEKVRW